MASSRGAELSFQRALLIGINYADKSCPLSGCVNDIVAVRRMLTDGLKWRSGDVMMLMEKGATAQGIRRAFRDLAHQVTSIQSAHPNARIDVWIHYSGHGSQVPSESPGERDGHDETIVPYDFETGGQISDSELANTFSRISSTNVHLTTVFDCCHSGTVMDLPFMFCPKLSDTSFCAVQERHANLMRWSRFSNVVCLTGCRDAQTSADYDGAGAMTTAMLKVLNACKFNITVGDLIFSIRKLLKGDDIARGGFSQTPQLSAIERFDQSTMFLSRDPSVPSIVKRRL